MRARRLAASSPVVPSIFAVASSSSSAAKPLLVVCSAQPYGYSSAPCNAVANGIGGSALTDKRAFTDSGIRPSASAWSRAIAPSESSTRVRARTTDGHAGRTGKS